MNALILGDNLFQTGRLGILRTPGAHRVATHLRDYGIPTEVVDFFLSWTTDELTQLLKSLVNDNTLFVGISCSLMVDGVDLYEHIKNYLRTNHPKVAIIIGGYATYNKYSGADYYLEGYSETAVIALVEHLKDPNKELKYELDDRGNKVIYTKRLYPINNLTPLQIVYQPSDFIQSSEALSLETGRGCIFKCKFCDFQLLGKKKVDHLRDPDDVRAEIINNYNNYGITKYILVEDTFNDTEEKVDMLYEITQSLPFKLQLMGYLRLDLLAAKPHTIKKLIDSGFTSMHFGIETMNDTAGKIVGKGMPAERTKAMLTQIKKDYPDVYINATFIVGLPGEPPESVKETAQWLIDSRTVDFWTFNPLMIPKKSKFLYSSEFSNNYMLYGYSKMPDEEVEKFKLEGSLGLFGVKALPFMVVWKNQYFNYFDAAKLTYEVNQAANTYKKIDAWTTFAISGLGIDLKEVQTHSYTGKNPIDQTLINQKSMDFINQYKKNKLNYLTKNSV